MLHLRTVRRCAGGGEVLHLRRSRRSFPTWEVGAIAWKQLADARQTEKAQQQAKAWEMWLDSASEREIVEQVGVTQPTVNEWVKEKRAGAEFYQPPASRQHFDVWSFGKADDDAGTGCSASCPLVT